MIPVQEERISLFDKVIQKLTMQWVGKLWTQCILLPKLKTNYNFKCIFDIYLLLSLTITKCEENYNF